MHPKKRPKYDFNSLTMEEARRGVESCVQNAERLVQAGKELYLDGFIEQATFLACAAIEEAGKADLLLNYQEQKFNGDPDAAGTLSLSFTQHEVKLESAIFSWARDTAIFREIQGISVKDKSIEEVSRTLRLFYATFKVHSPKAKARRTFKQRNQMLYTDFQNERFVSPQQCADKEKYEELVDIAEKTVARARMDAAIGIVFYKRRTSRKELGDFLLDNLPAILREFREKTKHTK